jgi:hypothetical protein
LVGYANAADEVFGIRGTQAPTYVLAQRQRLPPARKSRTMAATATHHTLSVRPLHSTPKFIPFDPSKLATKRPRPHRRNNTPKVDPSPHIPWTHIDEIDTEEVDLAGREPGLRSPEHQLLPTTTRDVDRTQSDTGRRRGFVESEGDGHGSRSPTPFGMREGRASSNPIALKGSSLGRHILIRKWCAFISNS